MKPARKVFAALALIAVFGCAEAPTEPVAQDHLVEQAQALSVLHDMFADPFMHELIEAASAPSLGRGFDIVAASAARGDISSASRALAATRHMLPNDVAGTGDDQGHDLAILGDVLELLLGDAERILRRVRLERDGGNDQQRLNRRNWSLEQ